MAERREDDRETFALTPECGERSAARRKQPGNSLPSDDDLLSAACSRPASPLSPAPRPAHPARPAPATHATHYDCRQFIDSSGGFISPSPRLKFLQKLLCRDPGAGIDCQFHFIDLLVDLLHEVDDEVDQLVAVHRLRVEVRDQE